VLLRELRNPAKAEAAPSRCQKDGLNVTCAPVKLILPCRLEQQSANRDADYTRCLRALGILMLSIRSTNIRSSGGKVNAAGGQSVIRPAPVE
jgi:hypothetical protein